MSGSQIKPPALPEVHDSFTGSGSGLANLNAANLASGTLPDGRLSGTYSNSLVFSSTSNTFTGNQGTFTSLCLSSDCRTAWPAGGGATWSLTGNAGTNPATNFLGTTDNVALVFRTNSAERVRVDTLGRVGIGTAIPNEQIEITGNFRLPSSTATTGVIKSGANRFIHNFGTENFFAGVNAGNLSLSGSSNTGVGTNALSNNTTGGQNTASGRNALASNTTGDQNTASGISALLFNDSGSSNTASGAGALNSNTTGGENTAIGSFALSSNTTIGPLSGTSNTASGRSALQNNTTGSFNTASGASALQNNITGGFNTASGVSALLSNNTGGANTASGFSALQNNTSGGNNTAIGDSALLSNTTGSNNTAIGFTANVSLGNLTNATAIGAGAVVDASNKIRLGNNGVLVIEAQQGLTVVSDKNQKENFQPVDGEEVLKKIRGLALTSWNFIGHDPEKFRHYGPMAQDFFAAFGNDGVGTIGTPTTINSSDMAGILMIAVQALEKQNREIKTENADLKARLERLERSVAAKEALAQR